MNNLKKQKKLFSATFLLIFTLSSILMALSLGIFNSISFNDDVSNEPERMDLKTILNQGIGEEVWWNASYEWRQCLNITNPGSYDLVDNIIKIDFNWKILYDSGHLQEDLDDIRIVENGMLRNYYIKKDFPSDDQATVWFEVNSTAGTSDYDTYMYYGNDTVERALTYYLDYCPDGIARWDFEEGSGNMVYDSMNNYDGQLFNMEDSDFIATPDIEGDYALSFDGSNEYIALNMSFNYGGSHLGYQTTTLLGPIYEMTASAWVKINLNQGGWSILDFDRSEYFTFAAGTAGYRCVDGNVEFDITNDVGDTNDWPYPSAGNILIDEDGEWHHCVVRFDYSKVNDKAIFVDGTIDAEYDVWSGLPLGDISETRFGFIGDGSEASAFNGSRNEDYFQGMLDDVRYFDYALSDKEIEWLANYYPLDIEMIGEVERSATVTVFVKDVDDRIVSGAKVSLWKNLTHILTVDSILYTQQTLSDGKVEFAKVPFGTYNITVNYTTVNGLYERLVYDSRKTPGADVDFLDLIVSTNVTADLWTIDFEVDDSDGDPLNYGHVNIGNSSISVIDTIPLDSEGKATFRWITEPDYNYSIYYDNPDYYIYPTFLNASTITRTGPKVYYQYIKTNISKLDILIMDQDGLKTVTGVKVKVQLNNTSTDVVELETDTTGYAYGDLTKDFGFWYLTEQSYNFSLWIIGQQQTFKVNTSDKWKPDLVSYYNYSLDQKSTLVFFLDGLNFTQRIANFTNTIGDSSVIYGEDMTFSVIYETSIDAGQTWRPDWNEGGYGTSAILTIYSKFGEKLLSQPMTQGSTTGNFTCTINSNQFSAGDDYEFYYALVSGYKPFWNDPTNAYFGISIYARPTGLTLHNYTSMPNELPRNTGGDYEIPEYYGYSLNISAKFYDNLTSIALTPESFTYEWDYGAGSLIPGPLAGYYTLEIDTSDATNVGKYRIDLTSTLENYSQIVDFSIYINILARPTKINGSSGLLYVSEKIYIFKAKNFTFNYIDEFSGTPISDLDEKSFLLQKLDETGELIPESTEMGSLIETQDNLFILDLDTEERLDGEYSIVVTLDKLNYDYRIAIISLTIMKRVIDFSWESDIIDSRLTLDSKETFNFILTLTDPNNETNPNSPIIGASVTLIIRDITYSTDNGWIVDNLDGTYRVRSFPIAEPFFMPETFIATLTIEKQYFSIVSDDITVVVQMQEFIGMPFFYFLMIVGAIVAVVGSLTSYRIIQQSRVPTFVKKSRNMKKDIKGNKSISESLLYPTKEEYIVKKLGDKWDAIGLSLTDVMGIEVKKKKLLAVKGEKPKKLLKLKREKLKEPEPEKKEEIPKDDEYNESYGGEP